MAVPDNVFATHPRVAYADIRPWIRSGDLLLAAGDLPFSRLIQRATESLWSHVAFVLRIETGDRVMLLESVESRGVRAVPLRSYLQDYNGTGRAYPGRLLLARHAHFAAHAHRAALQNLARFDVTRFGQPHDRETVARLAARLAAGPAGTDRAPTLVADEACLCAEYVDRCYQAVGLAIAPGWQGYVAPADFAHDPAVNPLWVI